MQSVLSRGRTAAWILAGLLAGCGHLPPAPPVDLGQPGWVLREGQAVWRPDAAATSLAGELVFARHPDGGVHLRFLKTPLTLVEVSCSNRGWHYATPAHPRPRSGPNPPPPTLGWLVLARALGGSPAPPGWVFESAGAGAWRLSQPLTGESIEGYLAP